MCYTCTGYATTTTAAAAAIAAAAAATTTIFSFTYLNHSSFCTGRGIRYLSVISLTRNPMGMNNSKRHSS